MTYREDVLSVYPVSRKKWPLYRSAILDMDGHFFLQLKLI